MQAGRPIPVNPARMLAELDELRTIGAVGKGVSRLAFSGADIAARIWLAGRMRAAGLEAVVDPWGNLFGLPPGEGPCLLIGSHSDTQPLGGWLDGIYGVACGLEIARAAREAGGPRIAVVSFQDEEGRFGGLTGSAVWAGAMEPEEADRLSDAEGITLAEARQRAQEIADIGEVSPAQFAAYLEPHIEQGPVLDRAGETLGVVEAIAGVRSLTLTFSGEANHAGTTPMHLRRDAVRGLYNFAAALDTAFAPLVTDRTVWTLGRIAVDPNAPSIVPGTASVSVQIRDPETARLDRLMAEAMGVAEHTALALELDLSVSQGFSADPVPMDPRMTEALAEAAGGIAPGRWRRMSSGALHDATHVSRVLPTAMLFVPSIGGISHNPDEDTKRADLEIGLLALTEAIPHLP
ncbi:N-carbamoyl-L-amino-acid hydrolase [Mesorhizobium sp. J18]|uniref:hydantoinase/carbamoylase family amidase n=1 Tax=Mesorhizobium sp. J18 TaxID=935263 RepID=UPI00119B2951|nr:hydantoinase/carbamoylase family amidase [Mesorhizobium sp. J18]TWG93207.1 N-carbamoyl-L-amino-acid hydrolase [Mesorhizobium sp. J18]